MRPDSRYLGWMSVSLTTRAKKSREEDRATSSSKPGCAQQDSALAGTMKPDLKRSITSRVTAETEMRSYFIDFGDTEVGLIREIVLLRSWFLQLICHSRK